VQVYDDRKTLRPTKSRRPFSCTASAQGAIPIRGRALRLSLEVAGRYDPADVVAGGLTGDERQLSNSIALRRSEGLIWVGLRNDTSRLHGGSS
jgi:hypothetical protein